MKILMISPSTGGIDVYVRALVEEMNKLPNVEVQMEGGKENEIAYDVVNKMWKSTTEVKRIVEEIKRRIDFNEYDIVAFHYGKNDVEQYIPVLLDSAKENFPKLIYFVHYLSWNLFSQYLSDKTTAQEIENTTTSLFDSYVFFGKFAQDFLEKKYKKDFPGSVMFLPETHSKEILSDDEVNLYTKEFQGKYFGQFENVVYFAGFPSNYKDSDTLLASLLQITEKMLLVFAGRGWVKKLGFEEKQIGNVQVLVVDKYLNSKEYKFLSSSSLFGIFPYRQPEGSDEYFQGSGTLPNYVYEGKATIVYDEGSLPEYVGKSGIVIKSQDTDLLAKSINTLLNKDARLAYEKEARNLKNKFSLEKHAKRVVEVFEEVLKV